MFPQKYRLTVFDFYRNPNKAQKISLSNISFLVKDSPLSSSRFAIFVSKSIDKHSSHRHQTRRIITEAIRPYLLKIKQSYDFLVKPKRILNKKERQNVEEELKQFFERLNLWE